MTEIVRPPKRNIPYSELKQQLARVLELAAVPLLLLCRRFDPKIKIRKILLVEPFMLGDASFLSIMLDPLKAQFPDAEIQLLIQPRCACLYENDARVSKIHAFHMPWITRRGYAGSRWRQFVAAVVALRCEKIDLAIDVRGEVRSQILMVLAGIPRRAGFVNYLCSDIVIKGSLLTDNAGRIPLQHRIHTCLDLCELVGCSVSRYHWLPVASQRQIPVPRRVLVHAGSGGYFRAWPDERWAELLRRVRERFGANIVLVGTSQEEEQNLRIADAAGFSPIVKITSLAELRGEIDQADVIICLDSAPLHLAVLAKKPVLALFGPGPTWLYEPVSPGSRAVHHQERFDCAPCAQKACVQSEESACMKAITVDDAFDVFCDMISNAADCVS